MADMTREVLQELVKDFKTFLQALDKIIPDRIDDELVQFLHTLEESPWMLGLVLNSMNLVKQIELKSPKRGS